MTPQMFYDMYTAKKEEVKKLHEELRQLEEDFLKEQELGLEYPIFVDGKGKYVRVEEAQGQYVYNKKLEVGVRATPKHPA